MGRGSSKMGRTSGNAPRITTDTFYKDTHVYHDYEVAEMDRAVNNVTNFINRVLEDDADTSEDRFYDLMGDEYSRKIWGDDAELVYNIDY